MPVPHRSTEPARPRAPDALVDFHTGRDLPNVCVRSVEDAARERGVVFRHAEQQRRGAGRRAPARDPGHARVAAQKLHGCGDVVRLAKTERDDVAVREACAREDRMVPLVFL